jgi:hypothetical protein
MIRLIASRVSQFLTSRLFPTAWIRVSAVTLLLQRILQATNSSVAQIGVGVMLILLLVSGVLLIALGVRDLIRDLRHFFHSDSHRDGHAPVA